MFKQTKKAPSVKIPAAVLKREAQRMAKKILDDEKKKEKKKLVKEKAKAKAVKQVSQKKQVKEDWEDFYSDSLKREIWSGVWIFLGLIIGGIFLTNTPFTDWLELNVFRQIFGSIMWLLPMVLIATGIALFFNKSLRLAPPRVIAILVWVVSVCGMVNLLLPHAESLALSPKYGGALGFAIGFFPREFLGDIVTWLILIALFWISSVVGFGLSLKGLLAAFQNFKESTPAIPIPQVPKITTKSEAKVAPVQIQEKAEPRFQNEIEIIDSTGQSRKKEPKKEIKLNLSETVPPENEMTEAKNQDFGEWAPPFLDLLTDTPSKIVVDEKILRQKAESIREKLDQFGIEVTMKSVHVGPTVTQFTLEPSAGVKLNKITALKSDLALALAASNVRIEAPIRGQKLVGIEIPNEDRAIVSMREILESEPWDIQNSNLKLALGRDVAGKPMVMDLGKAPHLLIAGKTGSGKSVAMNAFLVSLLWNNSPEDLRLILIDPKRVELAPYNHLPHLLTPVIVEPEKSVSALAWAVAEMNRRYKDFAKKRCRNIAEHNEKFPEEKEPFIVIVIDELADLMMVAGKDVEAAICRIAQMARAVGMHLIVATQRPSVDVVTGLIKANLPARIAFRVSSGIDSRTIIDSIGAEDLLGFGDMLSLDGNSGELTRIQGLLVTTEEVEKVTNHIKLQFPESIGNDEIEKEITNQSIEGMAKGGVLTAGVGPSADGDVDDLYEDAVAIVLETGKASASFLQRRMEVGYARAARLLDQMEARGVVGPSRGAKPREVFGSA